MRDFYGPATVAAVAAGAAALSAVTGVVGLFTAPSAKVPKTSTAAEDEAKERSAREEADRKTRAQAAARGGRRQTLLSPPGTNVSELNVGRRTLLGSTA